MGITTAGVPGWVCGHAASPVNAPREGAARHICCAPSAVTQCYRSIAKRSSSGLPLPHGAPSAIAACGVAAVY